MRIVVIYSYIIFHETVVSDDGYILQIFASATVENVLYQLRVATEQYTTTLDLLKIEGFFIVGVFEKPTVSRPCIELGKLLAKEQARMHKIRTLLGLQVWVSYHSILRKKTWHDLWNESDSEDIESSLSLPPRPNTT